MKTKRLQLRERAKVALCKLLSIRATPHQIAMGFAIGVFIGIFPTFGLGALLILALAPLWKFNIPAAILGTIMGNPIFAPVWITLTCFAMRISPAEIKFPHETLRQILAHYGQIGFKYLLGNLGISLVVAIMSYFSIRHAIYWFKMKRPSEKNITRNGRDNGFS